MDYEVVIGLEVHAELSTKTKIFCSCTAEFGGEPNTHCCPICAGMPGTLPTLNKNVVEYAIKAGLAMNCQISRFSRQDRKNYFYPDLPKAYQVSQQFLPLCRKGYIDIDSNGAVKRIGINRIHIEEDAGKLLHDEYGSGTLVDCNRGGVPLIEIVSEPDMRSAEDAKVYLENIKSILEYTGVSDCKMQEGSLRADVNISIRPRGRKEYGTRTEMKNLNSFRAIIRAIDSESKRQIDILESGGVIDQETRRWDDIKGFSYAMRSKEEAQDYMYFPEADLPPIVVDGEWLERVRKSLPELPASRKKRYIEDFGLPEYDAGVLTGSKVLADFFEEAIEDNISPKAVSNWIMGDLLRILKERGMEADDIPFPAKYLTKLISLIDKGVISGTMAKNVFDRMFDTKKDPGVIVSEEGLQVVSDEGILAEIVKKTISNNPKSVEDYKNGKDKALGFLMGQAMRETKGKADPQIIRKMLIDELS